MSSIKKYDSGGMFLELRGLHLLTFEEQISTCYVIEC